MSDVALVGGDVDPPLPAPEERGDLDIRTRALTHLVEQLAREVPGVLSDAGGLLARSPLPGGGRSTSPSAEVLVQGHGARVRVDVACRWPARVSDLAAAVRERVLSEGAALGGVPITVVDVTVRPRFTEDEGSRVR